MSDDSEVDVFVPLSEYLDGTIWPADTFGPLDGTFLDRIAYEGGDIGAGDDGLLTGAFSLRIVDEQTFDLPFGVGLILGAGPVVFRLTETNLGFISTVESDVLRIRFPRTLLVPSIDQGGGPAVDPDPTHFVELNLPLGVTVDENFDVSLGMPDLSEEMVGSLLDFVETTEAEDPDNDDPEPEDPPVTGPGFVPPTFFIGDTGVSLTLNDFEVRLSSSEPMPDGALAVGLGDDFRGIFIGKAAVRLPGGLDEAVPTAITFENCFIGTGGFTGSVHIEEQLSGSLGGADFTFKELDLTFVQNAPVSFLIRGSVKLPLFDDPLDIAVGLSADGKLLVKVDSADGLVTLKRENVLSIAIEQLAMELNEGVVTAKISGSLTPLYQPPSGHFDWPKLEVKELSVDTKGNVHFGGGWVDLPKQASFSLFGCSIEITKIGFGSEDDGHQWVGLSGGLKIVDGIKAGASVKGLRILWKGSDVSLSLEGVGVDLEIPNTLVLKGSVSLVGNEFRGGVSIQLPAISFTIDGQFVTGSRNGVRYFAIFIHGELPAGFPLGSTGLAIYGMAGLYAQNMLPDKKDAEGWYENPDFSKGWYLKDTPGITDLSKWKDGAGHYGFGAGITIGTFADNGYDFCGRLLLVLVFPGPLILVEGKANLFKKRTELEGNDPNFRALMVIEPGKSFLLDLDAHYKFRSEGELMDIHGSAEAYFASGGDWRIALGLKDDPKRRIGARVFKLFDVDSYFQLGPRALDIGASWGFDRSWGYSHLDVHLKDTFEFAASVSWHPSHFAGTVTASGVAELRAFGHGTGVSGSATITGDVFEPMHLKGSFHVGINLPWPLPDIGTSITLEWTEPLNTPPLLPLPLQEVSMEFLPRSLKWPFVRGTNLLPDNDRGEGEISGPPDAPPATFDFASAPVVPVDTQIGLNFSRPIDDPAKVGNNPIPVALPPEVIGDPSGRPPKTGYTQAYSLSSVTLEKVAPLAPGETAGVPLPGGPSGIGWVTVAAKGRPGVTGVADLFGSWTTAGTPQVSEAAQASGINNNQTKLMLNAKSPFEYTALSSKTFQDAFLAANAGYPCVPADPNEVETASFNQVGSSDLGAPGAYTFTLPSVSVQWVSGGKIVVGRRIILEDGQIDTRGLEVAEKSLAASDTATSTIRISVPADTSEVLIELGTPVGAPDLQDKIRHDPGGIYGVFDQPEGHLPKGVLTIQSFTPEGDKTTTFVGALHDLIGNPHVGMLVEETPFPRLELTPVVPASMVELDLFLEPVIEGDAGQGSVTIHQVNGDALTFEVPSSGTRRFFGPDIVKVTIVATQGKLCVEKTYFRTPVTAIATSSVDPALTFGPFVETEEGKLAIQGSSLKDILLGTRFGGEFAILSITVTSRRSSVVKHTLEALAQFSQDDAILEPETNYRLTVRTVRAGNATGNSDAAKAGGLPISFVEQAYFRTASLPGIGVPNPPTAPQTDFDPRATGFEDLSFYVRRTVPEIPPPAGGHTSPARAVYRAYDQQVEFNPDVNHVELMYRLGKRDLTLRLFDGNNRPLLGADGRPILTQASWSRSTDPGANSPSATSWIQLVTSTQCATSPPAIDPLALQSQVLGAGAEDLLLAPETLHQARLVPMLLHEAFVNARHGLVANETLQLDRWRVENVDATSSIASWSVESETVTDSGGTTRMVSYVTEANHVPTSLVYKGSLVGLDDTGHRDHPSQWQDVRASVQVRFSSGAVAYEVRRGNSEALRLTLTPPAAGATDGTVELSHRTGSALSVLESQPSPAVQLDQDLTVMVRCAGSIVEVFVQTFGQSLRTPIISRNDAPVFKGTVALVSLSTTKLRFSEIAVHDLRDNPSTAYRFDFITSRYTNFHHHLHSFDDTVFVAPDGLGLAAADVTAEIGFGTPVPAADPSGGSSPPPRLPTVLDDEQRSFERLEAKTLGGGALRPPERLEILRASHHPDVAAFLIRSPEPILWERTALVPSAASAAIALQVPGDVKLTGIAFSTDPKSESVSILVRQTSNFSGVTVEWRPLPDPTADPDPAWTEYFAFGAEAPLPEGTRVEIFSGTAADAPPPEPGTAQRFVATNTGDATIHFADPGVEVRVKDGLGVVLHQRQFLTDDTYAVLPMTAVRKVDGTALFLLLPSGSPVGAALRLAFAFTRNLGSLAPGAPVLRQAGSESPEAVVLDLQLA